MSDLYEAAREVRDAINVLDDTVSGRGGDVSKVLRDIRGELKAITSCLRDISDVMHAQFYGVKTEEQQVGDGEEDPGDEDGSQADA